MKDTALQDKVAAWHTADLDKAIDALGDVAADYERDGLRAVGHLAGIGGDEEVCTHSGEIQPC